MLNPAPLDRAWIARHIPHQDRMCLLDEVQAWDEQSIRCGAASHRAPDHPLRAHGQLGAACGIEYAAQAMAVHGALLAPAEPGRARSGHLVSVRDARLLVTRLDDIEDDLRIDALCISRDEHTVLYQFSVSAAGRLLLDGRATVVLDAPIRPAPARKTR